MKNESWKTLGDRLRWSLKNHPEGEKKQRWLQKRLGVSQGVVSQWCNNMQTPKQLHKIANELQVNYDWLSKNEGSPKNKDLKSPAPYDTPEYESILQACLELWKTDFSHYSARQIMQASRMVYDRFRGETKKSQKKAVRLVMENTMALQ